MKSDKVQPIASSKSPRVEGVPRLVFRRAKPTRELFLVKFAFWAVVVAFVLLLLFVLWGLAKNETALYDNFIP